MTILSTMVGAVVLSRAVNDEQLSKLFLQAPVKSLMRLSGNEGRSSSPVPRPDENRRPETASPQKQN
jgi:TetR/AcrR family transcriptional repressor of nem operon